MLSFKEYLTEARGVSNKGKVIQAEDHPLYAKRDETTLNVKSHAEVHHALNTDATSKKILAKNASPKHNDLVGIRLNLNVLKNTGVPVQTVHSGTNSRGYKNGSGQGFYKGEALSYHPVVSLKNAHFNVHQQGRENIASGKQNKHPMASVDGNFQDIHKHNFDGVELRFNPMLHHTFVDGNGHAVKSAEHVTIHGHRAYARGKIEYHTADTQPEKKGVTPSQSKLLEALTTAEMYALYEQQLDEEGVVAANSTANVPATGDDKETVVVKKKTLLQRRSNPNV